MQPKKTRQRGGAAVRRVEAHLRFQSGLSAGLGLAAGFHAARAPCTSKQAGVRLPGLKKIKNAVRRKSKALARAPMAMPGANMGKEGSH